MLSIRPFRVSDRDTLESHLMIPSISSSLPEFFGSPLNDWIDFILNDPHSYAIVLNDDMIGACRLDKNPHSDFSYWLHPAHRGKGYATQINNKLCRIAISYGWKSLSGYCEPSNISSQTVLQRCGFKENNNIWTKYL